MREQSGSSSVSLDEDELSLASVVDGVLPWRLADNRPFLRCLRLAWRRLGARPVEKDVATRRRH
jgi:hypothetical protein